MLRLPAAAAALLALLLACGSLPATGASSSDASKYLQCQSVVASPEFRAWRQAEGTSACNCTTCRAGLRCCSHQNVRARLAAFEEVRGGGVVWVACVAGCEN